MNAIVKENKLRVYICMAVLTFLLGALGTFASHVFHLGLSGTGAFLLLAGMMNLVAYWYSDRLVLRVSGARPLKREQLPQLYELAEDLCRIQQLPMPALYLIQDEGMNAFATGRDPRHAAVAVTKGLVEKLNRDEVKAVLAHELSHVKNYDTRLMAVISVLAGLISIVADIYWRGGIGAKVQERDRSGVLAWIGLALSLFAPLSAMLIQLAISRRRELLADASGASVAGHGAGLISALRKISMDRRPLLHVNPATAHLYFSSPYQVAGLIEKMFATHPPVEERIRQLEALGGVGDQPQP